MRLQAPAFLALVTLLAGCGVNSPSTSQSALAAASDQGTRGIVHGGQQPISGGTIQLWTVGSTGAGSTGSALISPAAQLLPGVALTDANGNFNITGQYTCPVNNPLVYLTASGGNPGLTAGTNNSAIVMLAALGACNSLGGFITVNEVTTVGSVYALSAYMTTGGSIGSSPANAAALASAFAAVNNFVSIAGGAALTSTSSGAYVPQAEIDSLADMLAPCVNTSAPNSSNCGLLFMQATPPNGGTQPATVLAAALDIALNPINDVGPLFTISTSNPPFQPNLSAAPPQWSVVLSYASSTCGYTGAGTTVSGTVSYAGPQTGPIYIVLTNNSGCNVGTQGTSISAPGGFTIRGVPPGTYALRAFMDFLGYGAPNAGDPTVNSTVTVAGTPVTGTNITLNNPSAALTITQAPTIVVYPADGGVSVGFTPLLGALPPNGREVPISYTLQWSASSSFTSIAGSKTFPATGTDNPGWYVGGLTDGSIFYFRAFGTSQATAAGPYSTVFGPVTIGPSTTGSTVSGSVSLGGVTATGPLYLGIGNEDTSTAPTYSSAPYGQYIANPANLQGYSVVVPNNPNAVYGPGAFLDQNNDGVIDAGDLSSVDVQNLPFLAVTGPIANENIPLPTGNSVVAAVTQTYQSGSSLTYGLGFTVHFLQKQPVAVTLLSSGNADGANVVGPIDLGLCNQQTNNCSDLNGFELGFSLGSNSPTAGDSYPLLIAYSDGSTESRTATVSAVLNNSSDFATSLAPTTGTSTSTQPTFTWTAPTCSGCGNYKYNFYLKGPGGSIWGVPNYGIGLPYTNTSLTWGVDPTDSTNAPTVTSLTLGTTYTWTVSVQDLNFNTAQTTVTYVP
jgi:hypothetical protein